VWARKSRRVLDMGFLRRRRYITRGGGNPTPRKAQDVRQPALFFKDSFTIFVMKNDFARSVGLSPGKVLALRTSA
jgi:hypothetical protein